MNIYGVGLIALKTGEIVAVVFALMKVKVTFFVKQCEVQEICDLIKKLVNICPRSLGQ